MQRSMRIGRRGEFCLEVLEWLHAYLWKIPCVRVIWWRWIFGGVSFLEGFSATTLQLS